MVNRSQRKILSLAASGSNTYVSQAIPLNTRLIIRKFGFADDGSADGKAVTFQLQFGSGSTFADIRLGASNAATYELPVNEEFIGKGTDFFRVITTNRSAANARNAAWWINAYDA